MSLFFDGVADGCGEVATADSDGDAATIAPAAMQLASDNVDIARFTFGISPFGHRTIVGKHPLGSTALATSRSQPSRKTRDDKGKPFQAANQSPA